MRRVPFAGLLLGGIAVFVTAFGSIALPAHTHSVAPIWPANAILLALVLRAGPRPAYQIVTAAAGATAMLLAEFAGRDFSLLAVLFTLANLVEVAVAAMLIRRLLPGVADLTNVHDLVVFLIVAGVLAPLASASVAAISACTTHAVDLGPVWKSWFISDALGMAIVGPFAVTFNVDDWRQLRQTPAGFNVVCIIGTIAAVAVASSYYHVFLFLGVPIVLLSAFSLDVVGTALATLLMTLAGAVLIIADVGVSVMPHTEIPQRIMAFQVFVAANVIWALPVAAIHTENKRLLAQVSLDNSRLKDESSHKSRMLTDLQRTLMRTEERERLRLARELHDETGQAISITMMELAQLEPLVRPDKQERVSRIRQNLEEIAKTLHHIAWQLRPTSINDCGLCQALNDYIAYWSARTQIPVDLHCAVADVDQCDDDLRTAVFRIVQEALTNVAKHADAKSASVVVERVDSVLHLAIEDDGRGFDPADVVTTSAGGLGLLGIRERVMLLGGEFQIESSSGAGTTLFARVPLDHGGRG
jgi:signal transduction histidine kinase